MDITTKWLSASSSFFSEKIEHLACRFMGVGATGPMGPWVPQVHDHVCISLACMFLLEALLVLDHFCHHHFLIHHHLYFHYYHWVYITTHVRVSTTNIYFIIIIIILSSMESCNAIGRSYLPLSYFSHYSISRAREVEGIWWILGFTHQRML